MDILQNINWSVPTWDLFILLFFLVGSLLYGLSMGRDRVIVILVSVYMALAVVGNAPVLRDLNAFQLSVNENFVLQIGFFLGTFLVLFLLISRSGLMHTLGQNASNGGMLQTLVFSILQVGLFISIALSFVPQEVSGNLTEITKQIFTSYWGKSAWLIGPVAFMAMMPKSRKHTGDNG
ncbi:hypothetical protein KJZ71_00705 [Patescibacteria group bacterium]|uniref:Uncharacterized protein n=1 Tax=candidate division WWE3 bacterium TaxID=2053526 RepID=A0A928TR56_UNCKA|nr:hypothetical protein [candidate division WWE3 bacterium]MCL4732309.1 hypothetical protein [Patescibacteria group bacterium]MDL1952557.1 hypothetical protein [Candidatus Uhrbacteria bacterium UHB]RIL00338.1 MAG: hypothetical protein DCC77_02095 [Candidatus Uhrbacteria bacterium]